MRPHPRVVIVGGGFGGLQCAKALRDKPVDVLLVDRHNYHLFINDPPHKQPRGARPPDHTSIKPVWNHDSLITTVQYALRNRVR